MLSRLGFTSRRVAARQWAGFHTAAPLRDAAEKKDDSSDDISPAGIDRTNPLYAPSWRREWKHWGYKNIANRDNPKEWKEWEDLPSPYKYYHVKVDPADVENEGLLWKLSTNWKTAIPLALGLSIPLFAFDVIVVDSHMELAAIFWASVAMVYKNFGQGIRDMVEEENNEVKKEFYGLEAAHIASLDKAIDMATRAMELPKHVRTVHAGERALKAAEASAVSRRVRVEATARMTEMLDYLVATQGGAAAAAGDNAAVAAQLAVDDVLAKNGPEQQATIADAIAALKAEGQTLPGNTTEKLFTAALESHRANPPKPDPAQAAAAAARDRDIFNKRFGFASRTATENEVAKAAKDPAAHAILTAKTGGNVAVGAALTDPNPIDYLRA